MEEKPSLIARLFGWLQPSTGNWQRYKQTAQGFIELRNLSKKFTEGTAERQVLNDLSSLSD